MNEWFYSFSGWFVALAPFIVIVVSLFIHFFVPRKRREQDE